MCNVCIQIFMYNVRDLGFLTIVNILHNYGINQFHFSINVCPFNTNYRAYKKGILAGASGRQQLTNDGRAEGQESSVGTGPIKRSEDSVRSHIMDLESHQSRKHSIHSMQPYVALYIVSYLLQNWFCFCVVSVLEDATKELQKAC